MSKTGRTLFSTFLCTAMVLFAGPVLAHDGSHELSTLQTFLHDLAYADYWPAALVLLAAAGALVAARRLARRRAARTKL